MNIILLRPADNTLISEAIIKWNLAAKKHFVAIGTYFLSVIIYLFIGLYFEYPKNGIWNFGTSLALTFTILILISAYNLYVGRQKWILWANNCIQSQKNNVPFEYSFTDAIITIRDSTAYSEINWSALSSFKLHKNYIFLYLKAHDVSSITIDRSCLSESDYNTLFSFICNLIPEKK